MGIQEFFHLPVFLFMLVLSRSVAAQYHRDTRDVSIFGKMLQKHIFKTITGAAFGDVCLRECYRDVRCQSFNYVFTQDKCELSNRTKEARPEDFVPNSERYYFRRDMKRAILGAIPELSADSCKEIKASEGGQAVSGKYWLNFIKPDTPVLVHCDMKTEDSDECNASFSVCDVNANCKNTLGSYRCSCRAGFSGNGRSCKDLDECSASPSFCPINADCENTMGSYRCSCRPGFLGNATTCYRTLNLKTDGRRGRFGTIQTFTVPRTTRYLIKAWGARGGTHSYDYGDNPGTYYGGKGAFIEGKDKPVVVTMRFFISVTLCIAYEIFAQECKKDEHAIFGMMLRRHTFKKLKSSIAVECNRACKDDFRCHSFNYLITEKLCELNNRTKEARPENFVPNSERYYVRSNKKRVPLGSILEFPAETCEEINASEDGKAKSGEYWIYSVITGKTALVSCDMEPEDIDECASGVHNCHSSASCTNTVGSFKCSCNQPYIGDGKSCIRLPSECQNYQSLTGSDRMITYGNQNTVCDRGIHGWYRFEGAAGTRMPTSCPPKQRCNTHASGWLNGAHPTVADGQVTRTVCFHWGSNCCNWSRSVNVINCGDYYVYYITGTPACSLRYCSTD